MCGNKRNKNAAAWAPAPTPAVQSERPVLASAVLRSLLEPRTPLPEPATTSIDRNMTEFIDEKKTGRYPEVAATSMDAPPRYSPEDPTFPTGVHAPVTDGLPTSGKPTLSNLIRSSPAITRDLYAIDAAIAAYQNGECGAKCQAKAAGRQLKRDIWAEKEAMRQGWKNMSKEDRKALKGEMRELKGMVKQEMRQGKEMRRGRCC